MNILDLITNAFRSTKCPKKDEDLDFFVSMLRVCLHGSRLVFDRSEPESFVNAFRPWSHRGDEETFEADSYTVDSSFTDMIEKLAGRGELELDHHFTICAPDGRPLCQSVDDVLEVNLADDIYRAVKENKLRKRK